MSAVTIDEVKCRLRVTTNDDNDLIGGMIEEAEDYIAAFIGTAIASIPVTEEDGQLVMKVPAGLRSAILQQVAFLYDGTPVDLAGALAPYREPRF